MEKQTKGKILKGEVVSDAMNKTVVVLVGRYKKNRKYGKYVRVSNRHKAHDENNEYKKGDKVEIGEIKPVSKGKNFTVLRKI